MHHRRSPDVLAVVALGGMLGATARYGLAHWWLDNEPGRFPWATFWANVTGSALLAIVLVAVIERFPGHRYARPFLATGVIGAYTTMSTYTVETALLVKDGDAALGVVYAVTSLVGGVAAAYAGVRVTRAVTGHAVDRAVEDEQLAFEADE